jgi:hypothetical protein
MGGMRAKNNQYRALSNVSSLGGCIFRLHINNLPEALKQGRQMADFQTGARVFGTSTPHYHDVPPMMMLLELIMAAVFSALKWQGPPTQGMEEVCGIGFGKNDFSTFLLIMPQQLTFPIILASVVTL